MTAKMVLRMMIWNRLIWNRMMIWKMMLWRIHSLCFCRPAYLRTAVPRQLCSR
jgi:hypothetical protein